MFPCFYKIVSTLFMWFMGALAYLIIPKKVDKIFLWGGFIVMICFIILLQLTSGSRLNEGTAISQYLPNRQALELLFAFFFRFVPSTACNY